MPCEKARVRSPDGGTSQACREPRNPDTGPALGIRGFGVYRVSRVERA